VLSTPKCPQNLIIAFIAGKVFESWQANHFSGKPVTKFLNQAEKLLPARFFDSPDPKTIKRMQLGEKNGRIE
jgi:hypothetical protein